MTLNISDLDDIREARDLGRSSLRSNGSGRDTFSTALFTSLNIVVFLILAASVVGAAILYGQGT
jgi:hypothetical protein